MSPYTFRPASSRKIRTTLLGGLLSVSVAALVSRAAIAEIKTENYAFTTFAGRSSVGVEDGPGVSARFFHPHGLAIDNQDNLYVADTFNQTIRLITPNGTVSTFAGSLAQPDSIDGALRTARFSLPFGLAVDGNHALYVADAGSSAIRKIAGGTVSTLGTAANLFTRFGPFYDSAYGDYLAALAVNSHGNIYGKCSAYAVESPRVLKLASDGTLQSVLLANPLGLNFGIYTAGVPSVAVDSAGNVLSTDPYFTYIYLPSHAPEPGGGGWLRSTLTPDGVTIDTTTGGSHPFYSSDASGTVYLIDTDSSAAPANLTVKVTAPNGTTSSFASAAPVDASRFPITGVVRNRAGDFFYLGDQAVFKLTAAGTVTIVAGTPASESFTRRDGTGTAARFTHPTGIATDRSGNIYVNDGALRKISSAGVVTTLIGPPAGGPNQPDPLVTPALAVDDAGNAYFISRLDPSADFTLSKRAPDGTVSTLAVSSDTLDLSIPNGGALTVDHLGNVFVAGFAAVYKVTPQGDTSVFAGMTGVGQWGYAEGSGSSARFFGIMGLAVDSANNVLVADSANRRVRKIAADGVVSTISGGVYQDLGDNPRFDGRSWPGGVAVDGAGNVFVTGGDNTVRQIAPDGVVTLLGGGPETEGNLDGVGSAVRFLNATAIAIDPAGKIYVTDTTNNTIRQGQPAGPPVITAQPLSLSVAAGTNVQFSMTASGVPAPTYQWYFNGGVFSGATTNTLSFTNARSTDAGDYTVVATNELGSVTSSKATLTVTAAPANPPTPPSGASGGGSFESWFVLALSVLAVAGRDRCRLSNN